MWCVCFFISSLCAIIELHKKDTTIDTYFLVNHSRCSQYYIKIKNLVMIAKSYVFLYKNVCSKIFGKNEKQDSEISSMTHVVRQQIHQSEVSGRSFLYKLFVYLHYKVSIIYLSIKWMWDFLRYCRGILQQTVLC